MDLREEQPENKGIAVTELKVGDVLDERYQLDEIIGRGGCGIVFRATDLNLQRDVAVKVLSSEGSIDESTLRKFDNESQILRRLHAQNTVFFYDCGQTDAHQPYIVMEFVSGQQLKDLLEIEGKLQPERAVAILTQVFSALEEAHEYGFIHRDLKPGNIMLCQRPGFPDDFVKVLDFGIAKIMSEDEKPGINRENSEMAGTPKYMPPEQFKNEQLTPAADLYSMGCIAYEMLTGIAPFDGETLHVTVAKHLMMTPRSFSPEIEAYPNLAATVFKLLEKQPEDRFSSAHDVLNALEHWHEPVLIPMLEGCRIKGDDEQDNSFFEEDSSEVAAITSSSIDMLSYATQVTTSKPIPIDPLKAHRRAVQAAPLPLKSSTHRGTSHIKYIFIAAGCIFAALVIIILLAIDPLSVFEEPEEIPQQTAPAMKRPVAVDPIVLDIVNTAFSDSSMDALAFGLQTSDSLTHLDDIFYDLREAESNPKEADGEEDKDKDDSRAEKDNSASAGESKHKRDKSETQSPLGIKYPIFEFTLKYTPTTARVAFISAQGVCSSKGVCQVKTTSDKVPAKIIVSAEGYATKSLIISRKTSSVRIDLRPIEQK